MANNTTRIQEYRKTKDWLFCIDSDGCAINSMDVKHQRCFGPSIVDVWPDQTKEHKDFLNLWNDINLYTSSRGVNRFKGLVMIFEYRKSLGLEVPDLSALKGWAATTSALSPKALEEEFGRNPLPIYEKALLWSKKVNEGIAKLAMDDCPPYPGVKETLEKLSEVADIAVVSSANKAAMLREWEHFGLADYCNVLYGQEDGTKSLCIERLLGYGYDPKQVVMIGDAMGDLQAAEDNQVWYYPITVKHEAESWSDLSKYYIDRFVSGSFTEEDQVLLKKSFSENLPPTYEAFVF